MPFAVVARGTCTKLCVVSLENLLGQPIAQTTLLRALSAGKLHHAYRFEGPEGVGKETAAFLLAQALVCATPTSQGGCGTCSPCRRAVHFSSEEPKVPQHPDVILVGRGVYPPSLLGGASEATGISVEQIRRIVIARLGFPPHEGRARVVIIRAADELTIAAGNALLKTLEEPDSRTHFVLLTARPMKLLDTIRSRTLAIRFGPLRDEVMKQLLDKEGLPADVLPFAQGSLASARSLASPEVRELRDEFVQSLDRALTENHPRAALVFAETRPEGRSELIALLAHTASAFALRARQGDQPELYAARHQELVSAIREVEANGSAGLVLESMVARMMTCA